MCEAYFHCWDKEEFDKYFLKHFQYTNKTKLKLIIKKEG